MNGDNLPRITPPTVVFSGDLRGPRNTFEKSARAHGPADTKITEVIGEVKQTLPKFDTRYILADINCLCFGSPCHIQPLPRSIPERGDDGLTWLNRKGLGALIVPFLSTVPFERQTAGMR